MLKLIGCLICLPLVAGSLHAQVAVTTAPVPASSAATQVAPAPGAATAFALEALGGIAGSAIGFGAVVILTDDDACGENLSCTLGHAATALLLGTAGAAAGAWGAGQLASTRPSGVGAVIGAVAGAGAILGVDHVLSGADISDTTRFVAFAVSQGVLTAAGSRIGAMLR